MAWADQQWLYYRGWPANTGPNTCYGDFGVTWLVTGLIIEISKSGFIGHVPDYLCPPCRRMMLHTRWSAWRQSG